ncbi:MAG: tetratricopeptide repeat protein, partial [Verrucomicrobiota bacterium]
PILLLIPFASLALIAAAAPGNRPQYTAAAAAAIIALSPTLGLVPFAFQAISTVADRYCYLAMVGVALAVALLIRNTQSSWPPFLALAIAGLFAAISSQQVTRWNSSVSLFDHTLTVNPQSVIAAYNLGIAKSNNEAPKEAITHYKNAIAINPNFQPAYNNLGYLLLMQNQPANALDPLKIAVSLDPDDPVARSNLGIAHDHLKQFPEAITQHKEALRLSPREPNNLIQLGYSLANHGKLEEAVDAFSNAHQLNPSNRLHLEGLEKIANQTKDAKAAQSARQALEDITQN